jgi:hypothetical protein
MIVGTASDVEIVWQRVIKAMVMCGSTLGDLV